MDGVFKFVSRQDNGTPTITLDGKKIPLPWLEDNPDYYEGFGKAELPMNVWFWYWATGTALGLKGLAQDPLQDATYTMKEIKVGHRQSASDIMNTLTKLKLEGKL